MADEGFRSSTYGVAVKMHKHLLLMDFCSSLSFEFAPFYDPGPESSEQLLEPQINVRLKCLTVFVEGEI